MTGLHPTVGVYALSVADQDLTVAETLNAAKGLGFRRCLFPSILTLSPTLERAEIHDHRNQACDIGVEIVVGLPSMHPFRLNDDRSMLRIGDGDALKGFIRVLEESAEFQVRDLPVIIGRIEDRYGDIVPWSDQLDLFRRLVQRIATPLRRLESRLAIKTHEEISAAHVLRLVDELGDDLVSIGFDPVNMILNLEDPTHFMNIAASHVSHIYIDDAIFNLEHLIATRLLCNLGSGLVDWEQILNNCRADIADANLWIELHRGQFSAEPFTPEWVAHHEGIRTSDYARVVQRLLEHAEADSVHSRNRLMAQQGLPANRMPAALEFCARHQLL